MYMLMGAKKGLWSVNRVKGWPSRKNLKCLTERKAARSSLSKVEFLLRGFFWRKRKGVAKNRLVFAGGQLPHGNLKHLLRGKGELWDQDVSKGLQWPKRILYFERSPGEAAFSFGGRGEGS